MKFHNDEEEVFNVPITFNVLPKEKQQKFKASDTTPSVLNHKYWIANNTGAVTVTDFDEGAECQEIIILGDGFTTVANGTPIKTNTGANKLLAVNRVYRFVRFNSIWVEQ